MQFRRKLWTGTLAALAVLVVIGGLWTRHRAEQLKAEQKVVHAWTGEMHWWDHSRTETENLQRQVDELRKIAPQAVNVLTRELTYREPSFVEKLPALRALFRRDRRFDDPEQTRVSAAHYLGALGPAAIEAVPQLIHALDTDTDRVRMTAAFSLGQSGNASPEVIAALTRASRSQHELLATSAEFSLWQLTGSTSSVARLHTLITNSPSWASLCIMRIGESAKPFASTLLAARDQLPWGDTKMQTVEAHWKVTGDKQVVLEVLRALGSALTLPSPTSATNAAGWTDVESAIGYAAHRLDTEPEFRAALRPQFERILTDKASPARAMAQTYLRKHADLDAAKNGP